MPEIPDVAVYVESLDARLRNAELTRLTVHVPFLLRTVAPSPSAIAGRKVTGVTRLGKRIGIGLVDGPWLVLHLMRAGRLRWREAQRQGRVRNEIARLDFDTGQLCITEAGKRRMAALHIVADPEELRPPGPDALECTEALFVGAMRCENHTLKRALTDQRLIAGIGNAYSDEILHRAGLSPLAMTSQLVDEELARLYLACQETLTEWTDRIRDDAGVDFPTRVTAFRDGMAVHGRHGKPCPDCGTTIQRIRYASNETNYCPSCQTGGRIYADRALSRLLRNDWPRNLQELENARRT